MPGILFPRQESAGMTRIKLLSITGIALIAGIVFAPYSSKAPDGLESTLALFNAAAGCSRTIIKSPLQGYDLLGTGTESSGILAGAVGTVLSFAAGAFIVRRIKRK